MVGLHHRLNGPDLSKLGELVMVREDWLLLSMGSLRDGHARETEQTTALSGECSGGGQKWKETAPAEARQ